MRGIPVLLATLTLVALADSAQAAIAGSATIHLDSITGPAATPTYHYTITLQNTGNTTIGTLWYAWIPGEDFLTSAPTITSTPQGWLGYVNGGGPPYDGYSIQWYDYFGNPLNPTHSITFGFTTPDSPTVLAGHSPYFPGTPTQTSFLYQAEPEGDPATDPSLQIVLPAPTGVPEPASLALLGTGIIGLLTRNRRRT